MLNVCALVGRLGKDPEVRRSQSGTAVLSFSMACDRDFKGADGNHETDWIPVVCFGQTAEFVGKYAKKGSLLSVTGRLQNREWTDRDNNKRTVTEIVADKVSFVGSPPQRDNQQGGGYQSGGAYRGNGSPGGYGGYQGNQGYNGGGYGSQGGYGS